MYRIGKPEIEELTKVIEARDLFKINNGLQESKQVETKLIQTAAGFLGRQLES